MRFAAQLARWTLVLSMSVLFAGCGERVTGPPSGPSGGGTPTQPQLGPEIMVVHPDGTVSWTHPPLDWGMPAADEPHGTSGPGGKSGPGESNGPGNRYAVTKQVKAEDGGTIQCGRFYLTVPPGALDDDATITMSAVDSTVQICDIEIYPASLNRFREPVQLALCTTGLDVGPDSLTMYFYDEEDRKWVDMRARTDLDQDPDYAGAPYPANMQGIAASLEHFSRYGGGKAGW